MTTTTIERVAPSTPVTPAWMTPAVEAGRGVDVFKPRAIERDIQEERNSMYTYQTPGFMRSDSGDGPRRIAVTINTATFGVTRKEAV